jgi:predicted HAD superfamily Cof-like phosphohydrolase
LAYPIQQAVADFHKKFGHPVREGVQPAIPEEEAKQAFSFIQEELDELWEAMYPDVPCDVDEAGNPLCFHPGPYNPDPVAVADALGDIIVTAFGKGLRWGIDSDLVLKAIMESNMTKEANGMGKIKKGADYRKPDIRGALGL